MSVPVLFVSGRFLKHSLSLVATLSVSVTITFLLPANQIQEKL